MKLMVCGLAFALSAGVISATELSDREQLIGSWDLVSLENRATTGEIFQPLGEHPVGRFTYTADGKMSAQLMRGDRVVFKTTELYSGTAAEKATAYDSYVAYYGSFEVDPALHKLTHHVAASLFPNWTGGEQIRFYELHGDELILSTKPFQARGKEVTAHVVWRRVH